MIYRPDDWEEWSQESEPLGPWRALGRCLLVMGVAAGAVALIWTLLSRGLL